MTGNSYIGLDKNKLKRKFEEVNRTNTLKTYALFSGILAIASVLLIIAMMLIIFVVRGFYLDWGYFIEFSLGVMFASFILFIASAELYLSALNFVPEKLLKKEDEKKAEIDDLIRIFVKFSQKRERQAKIAKNIGLLLITASFLFILVGWISIFIFYMCISYLLWTQLNKPKLNQISSNKLNLRGISIFLFISSLACVVVFTIFEFGGWILGDEWSRTYYYIAIHGTATGFIVFILILFSLYSMVLALVSLGSLSNLKIMKLYRLGSIFSVITLGTIIALFFYLLINGVGAIFWWIGPSFYVGIICGIINLVLYRLVMIKMSKIE